MGNEKESIFDYLKKPSGYMTIVILIITIIATFWVTSHFHDKKEITVQESQYNFLTRNKIDDSDVSQHIQIYYDNKEIYDPYVIKITFINSGNQEITAEDFKSEKFEISFNKNIILYDASISNTTSKDIKEELISKLEIKDNCLLIDPFLLNANESFTLSLITNQESEIFYNFRIVGISNTKKEKSIYINKFYILVLGCSLLFAAIFTVKEVKISRKYSKPLTMILLPIISFIVTLITTLSILFNASFEIGKNMQQFIFK